jgi:DNA-binding GntR family transcriptional regulator
LAIVGKEGDAYMAGKEIGLLAPTNRTLSDYVADRLREAILSNRFKPGERIVEQEIAEAMETSRGPVRDALIVLENEGLVVRRSHRGAVVSQLDEEDVIEIYTLREALESLAIKYAIRNATEEQIGELESLVSEMEKLAQQDYSQAEATDIDIQFHHTLCRISGHKRVLAAWEALSAQIRLVLLKHRLYNPIDYRNRAVKWHTRIIDSIRRRDTAETLQELKKHMLASLESLELEFEPDQYTSQVVSHK